jgi:hypothetical protein
MKAAIAAQIGRWDRDVSVLYDPRPPLRDIGGVLTVPFGRTFVALRGMDRTGRRRGQYSGV